MDAEPALGEPDAEANTDGLSIGPPVPHPDRAVPRRREQQAAREDHAAVNPARVPAEDEEFGAPVRVPFDPTEKFESLVIRYRGVARV